MQSKYKHFIMNAFPEYSTAQKPTIIITAGDPDGIGVELCIKFLLDRENIFKYILDCIIKTDHVIENESYTIKECFINQNQVILIEFIILIDQNLLLRRMRALKESSLYGENKYCDNCQTVEDIIKYGSTTNLSVEHKMALGTQSTNKFQFSILIHHIDHNISNFNDCCNNGNSIDKSVDLNAFYVINTLDCAIHIAQNIIKKTSLKHNKIDQLDNNINHQLDNITHDANKINRPNYTNQNNTKHQVAIVTLPIDKASIIQTGLKDFVGHTEYFAVKFNQDINSTVMLMYSKGLKVALVTNHLPISKIAQSITKEKLKNTLFILADGLKKFFGIKHPRIAICGLNPHCGESGFLGREEIEVIYPVINEINQDIHAGLTIIGCFAADTLFYNVMYGNLQNQCDVILSMYHDQCLPVFKYHHFYDGVNCTLGLPILRTSVDHGTAKNLVGKIDLVDHGSMREAIIIAIRSML